MTLDSTTCEICLGSAITNSTKIADDVTEDIKLRQVSIVKYFAFLRNNSNAPVDVKLIVLDACILSSLLYNAETWANAKFQRLEIVYRRMLKSILGVGMTTCTEFLYLELGVLSVKVRVIIKQWKFWKKVLAMNSWNPLAYVIQQARKYKLKEVKHYDDLVNKYSSVEDIVNEFNEDVKAKIRSKAENGRSKYITYLEINPELETPQIYEQLANKKLVSMIAKLRTSSHNLRIEMGRRTGTSREQRICHCGNDIETERHFLLECGLYHEMRAKHHIESMQTPVALLNNVEYVNFIRDCFDERKKYV